MNMIPLITFVIITTFTPGPNNISSASLGITFGYKRALPYLFGIMTGFLLVMFVCSFLSNRLMAIIPEIEKYMKYIGSVYILYLAFGTLYAEYKVEKSNKHYAEFKKGFLLQLVNPKVAIYGLTLYSTFLLSILHQIDYLIISAILFAITAFCATSLWAIFGAFTGRFLKNLVLKRIVNIILSILLIITAIELSGILP